VCSEQYGVGVVSLVVGDGAECVRSGMASVWSVWSWVTELSVFGAVPVGILALNVCVISETHKMSAREFQLNPRFSLYIFLI